MSDQTALGAMLVISIVISIGGFVILGSMLREMQTMTREAQQLTKAVGMLVIQETAKLPGKHG